jgi:hypothetical protein
VSIAYVLNRASACFAHGSVPVLAVVTNMWLFFFFCDSLQNCSDAICTWTLTPGHKN